MLVNDLQFPLISLVERIKQQHFTHVFLTFYKALSHMLSYSEEGNDKLEIDQLQETTNLSSLLQDAVLP